MKKIILAILTTLVLFAAVCSSVLADDDEKITHQGLPWNSKIVGSYSATFCDKGFCWDDSGSYKASELVFSKPHAHIRYLYDDKACLNLAAKPGYTWEWRKGGLLHDGAFYLVKVK